MTEGKHYGGFKYRNKQNQSYRKRNSFIGAMITTIVGTVVKDLTSENSKIKKLISKVIHPKQIEEKRYEKKIIDAEYKVISNNNQNILKGKDEQ